MKFTSVVHLLKRCTLGLICCIGLSAGGLWASPANASNIRLPLQMQITGLLSMPTPTMPSIGGGELHGSVSFFGLGLSAGLTCQQLEIDGTNRHYNGCALVPAAQLRPLATASSSLHERIEPHVSVGMYVGGGKHDGNGHLQLSGFIGAGVDVPIIDKDSNFGTKQLFLTAHYRLQVLQTPSDVPSQIVLLGIGLRDFN